MQGDLPGLAWNFDTHQDLCGDVLKSIIYSHLNAASELLCTFQAGLQGALVHVPSGGGPIMSCSTFGNFSKQEAQACARCQRHDMLYQNGPTQKRQWEKSQSFGISIAFLAATRAS